MHEVTDKVFNVLELRQLKDLVGIVQRLLEANIHLKIGRTKRFLRL